MGDTRINSQQQINQLNQGNLYQNIEQPQISQNELANALAGTNSTTEQPLAQPTYLLHQIAKGNTLYKIAKDNGISVKELVEANGISEDTILPIGKFLKIPVKNNANSPQPQSQQAVQPLKTEEKPLMPQAPVIQNLPQAAIQPKETTYSVKAGDSLWKIAKDNGINVKDLVSVNNINENSILSIGQNLKIPVKNNANSPQPQSQQAVQPFQTEQKPPVPQAPVIQNLPQAAIQPKKTTYSVKAGDSLWKIAKDNGISVKDLVSANNINENSILSIGQNLKIPAKNNLEKTEQSQISQKTKQQIKPQPILKNYVIPQTAKIYWNKQNTEVREILPDIRQRENIYNVIYLCDKKPHIGVGHLLTNLPDCLKNVKTDEALASALKNPANQKAIQECLNKNFEIARKRISDTSMKSIPNISSGLTITSNQIELLLAGDVKDAQNKTTKYIKNYSSLAKGQKKALLDMFYNIKTTSLANSNFVKLVNNNKFVEAQAEMDFFGKPPALGLIKRRYQNMLDWNSGLSTDAQNKILNAINTIRKEKGQPGIQTFLLCKTKYLSRNV